MGRPRKQESVKPESEETQEHQDNGFTITPEELALIQARRQGKVQVAIAPSEPDVIQDPKKVQRDIKETNPSPNLALKSVPRHKQDAYIKWHREAHTRETHFEWCHLNQVPFEWSPLQPSENE